MDEHADQSEGRSVVMLAYPGAQLLDISGPLEVFARTSRFLAEATGAQQGPYRVEIVGREAGPVAMSSGLQLVATRALREVSEADTLLISGGIGYEEACRDAETVAWIAAMATRTRRIASICTGAFLLAASGLLRDREATTHWAYCDRLAAAAPGCRVPPDAIFVHDGPVYSSAGVTAGMDLALALVEEDHGAAAALAVAQALVMYVKRPGGQAQFSRQLEAEGRSDRFGALHLWLLDNLAQPLSVEAMAEHVGMSPRHFTRRFSEAMGQAPAAYLMQLRLEQARRQLEQGSRNLKNVARSSGFGSEQTMRRAFLKLIGVTPSDYGARFAR